MAVSVANSQIRGCVANYCLIAGDVEGAQIIGCQAAMLVGCGKSGGDVASSQICNCYIQLAIDRQDSTDWRAFGGIAAVLDAGSEVEKCYVSGKVKNSWSGNTYFAAIAAKVADGRIRQCAVGKLEIAGRFTNPRGRIAGELIGDAVLENNIAIDTVPPVADKTAALNGTTVAAALFNQYYLEHTLEWDFDTVWEWDEQENHPRLRAAGLGAGAVMNKQQKQSGTVDLLAQQMRANIWL